MTMTFGQAVAIARQDKKLTVRQLALAVGCSAPFVSDVEHDHRLPKNVAVWETALGLKSGTLVALDGRQTRSREIADVKTRLSKLEEKVERMVRKGA